MQVLGENADKFEVTMLLTTGADLHNYQPTADDIVTISSCDMFIYVGGHSDSWVDATLNVASNKDMKEQMLAKQREEKFKKESGAFGFLKIIAICVTAVVFALFFLDWAQIYNTTIVDKEVSFTGFNALIASLSGTYRSPEAIYGDLAIPFYYYAAEGVKSLCLVTTITTVILVALVVVQAVAIIRKEQIFNLTGIILSFALTVMLFVCYSVAIKLNDSQILPIYCSGNPACSIKSYVIVPAIISIISIACYTVPFVSFMLAKARYKN